MTSPRLEAGSFRDREGRVFYHQGEVYRALSPRAHAAWQRLSATAFFKRAIEAGRIVKSHEAELPAAVPVTFSAQWVAALHHQRIPFVSYPYEWTFGMLRDAALLQLELLREALGEEMILKDASAYNVQWLGARPTFIDVASFEPLAAGAPWVGYLQFCQLFLYPLFLTAYRGLPFQPWLRGAIDGITPEECNRLLSFRDRFRRGVFTHVYLQAKLQGAGSAPQRPLRRDLQQAGFSKQLILANVKGLEKTVRQLRWQTAGSTWADYADDNSYDGENRAAKRDFVTTAAATRRWSLVWDLGANTGDYSRIAAAHADYVVALDGDRLAVERLYQRLQAEGPANILPLTSNLADPSPALGWRHRERRAFSERPRPELVLCLALIHHLVISANIPLPELVDWLAGLGGHLVIEFVTKDDAMVKRLLRNKDDIYDDYTLEVFEASLGRHYEILQRQPLLEGTRILFFAALRSAS